MTNKDSLQRFMFRNGPVRGELVHLNASWQAVLQRHEYPEPVRDLLGEMMVATALLAATLKFKGSLIMQLQGEGPVTLLVAEYTNGRTMRALARYSEDVPVAPLSELSGNGRLVITLDPHDGGRRYQSMVPLEGETLCQALEAYLVRSEQLDTRLWVAANESAAAGMLLQRLPGEQADRDTWNRTVKLGETVQGDELLELSNEDLLYRLYHEEEVVLFEAEPVSFRCSCTRERVRDVLRSLGEGEVQDILKEKGRVSVNCQFCNQQYEFDEVDAKLLFVGEPSPEVPPTRH